MQCIFIKPDNSQCEANAMAEFELCFSHNPKVVSEKMAAVRKGGKSPKPRKTSNQRKPIPIRDIGDVLSLLEGTINELRTEEALTHQRANSIGYLSGIILRALEVKELEDRVSTLESKLINQN